MTDDIKVSIIMGTYNEEKTIAESIDSIINQTYKNWELIIDDCSNDSTCDVIKYYQKKDSRIILNHHDTRISFAQSLNNCIKQSNGKYIARMDPDDYSLEKRIEREVTFLEENNEFDFVSCNYYLYDGNRIINSIIAEERPTKKSFLWSSVFLHPGTMFKASILKNCGGYITNTGMRRVPEDYELFMRLYSLGYKGYNIQEFLFRYFVNQKAIKSKRKFKHRFDEALIRYKGFKSLGLLPQGIPYVIKPIIVGLIPSRIAMILQKKR